MIYCFELWRGLAGVFDRWKTIVSWSSDKKSPFLSHVRRSRSQYEKRRDSVTVSTVALKSQDGIIEDPESLIDALDTEFIYYAAVLRVRPVSNEKPRKTVRCDDLLSTSWDYRPVLSSHTIPQVLVVIYPSSLISFVVHVVLVAISLFLS